MEYNDKQLQIIETAEKLFANKGFNGTSVRDIALEANINIAMISYYFGSKEKLFEALFLERSSDSTKKLESIILDKQLSSIEKIENLIDFYVDKFQNQSDFYKIMTSEQSKNNNSAIYEIIFDFKKKNLKLLKQIVLDGQKKDAFKKNIDISMMINTLIGSIGHLFSSQHYYKNLYELQNLSDDEFKKLLKKKLSTHLKLVFKATLTNEK